MRTKNNAFLNSELFNKLEQLDLPTNDYAVFGSGPLLALGLIKFTKDCDLDIIARGSAWEKSKKIGILEKFEPNNDSVIKFYNGKIEIYNNWRPGVWDIDKLIDQAKVIDGVKFVRVDEVIRYKKMLGREKDIKHLKSLKL